MMMFFADSALAQVQSRHRRERLVGRLTHM